MIFAGLAPENPYLSCTGKLKSGHNILHMSHQHWRRKRITSLELQSNIFHILPRYSSSPLLQVHSCQFMVNLLSTRVPRPAKKHCFLEIWPSVCTDVGYSFPYKQFPLLNFKSFLSACAFSLLRSLQMAA